jgi:hypothetical protein
MSGLGTPTFAERLRNVADNLNLVYPLVPIPDSDDMPTLISILLANSRKRLPSVRQLCAGVSPDDKHEHLIICPVCGQMFDCRDVASLEHHSSEEHAPNYGIRPS